MRRRSEFVTANGGRTSFIIALTGWELEGADREHSQHAGCDAHLVKPVDLEELNASLGERQASQAAP